MTIKQILQEKGVDATLKYIYDEIEGMERKKDKMIHEIAKLAIEPAESVLHIFENEYPKDDRPRKAIEAAKKYFDDPSEEAARAARAAEIVVWTSVENAKAIENEFAMDSAEIAAYAADSVREARAADNWSKVRFILMELERVIPRCADSAATDAIISALNPFAWDKWDATIDAACDASEIARRDAEQEMREKIKEIILKYFGNN